MSNRRTLPELGIHGRASAEGTSRFAERHAHGFGAEFYRTIGPEPLRVSSLGIGTYLGDCNDVDDRRYTTALRHAMARGINFIDTAINYRCQRSERCVGRALAAMIEAGDLERDEVVVCTKGGYVPLDGEAPNGRDAYRAYVESEYFASGVMQPLDLVAGGHCLSPGFVADQIRRSRRNLGLETIDIYYLHNPEQQLDVIPPQELYGRIRDAFALLEEKCREGEIGCYGVATWDGFRVAPEMRGHLSLADLHAAAVAAGGSPNSFRAVQLPINLALTEAIRAPTQRLSDGRVVPLLNAAAELGIAVLASATLLQSRLTSNLPSQLHEAIPGLDTDAQRAIAFVRSLPVVASALVGMRRVEHVEENLGAVGK